MQESNEAVGGVIWEKNKLEGSVHVCTLTGWPGGGAVVFLFSSRDMACQRFGRPGQGRPLLWAAVCSLLIEHTHTHTD